ncbi:MAG TPA: class F sortase, partial [Chloroflexota bacterium]
MPRFRRAVSGGALTLTALLASTAHVSAATKVNLVPPGWPKQISIPRLKVQASVESLAFRNPADLSAPYKWSDVAWYDLGPRPGDQGIATVFGHLDSTCCPAVFWNLGTLVPGDVVRVAYPGNRTISFRVMWKQTYVNNALPVRWMFSRSAQRGMTLVTCAGTFHHDGTGYDHKLLVYTRMILPGGTLG